MRKKPKTRFVVEYEGKLKERFSIQEESNGDLRLMIKSTDNYTKGLDLISNPEPIKVQRYSIHRPVVSKNNVCTIKQTIELKSGKKIETYLLSSAIHENKIIPIYFHLNPDLSLEKYDRQKHNRDTHVNIATINNQKGALLHGVLVTSLDGPKKINESTNIHPQSHDFGYFSQRFHDFKLFRIIVVVSHSIIPASPDERLIHSQSINMKVNGKVIGEEFDVKYPGFDKSQANTIALWSLFKLNELAVEMLEEKLPKFPMAETIKKVGPGLFTIEQYEKKFRKK